MTFLQKFIGVIAVFSITSSLAQAVEVKATITHPYEGGFSAVDQQMKIRSRH